MKQSHCIKDTAGFAEGGDAGGQAGGKARSTEAYRLHRGPFSKQSLHQRTVILRTRWGKKTRTTQSRTDQSEAAILRSAYSGFCCIPPVVRRLLK
jgi:hypothetical protein